jgi:polyhydroxyalkanoate synthesis regulator phasin
MATPSTPMWKQVFDAVDRRVSPAINELAKSEDVTNLAALGRRSQSELNRRMEQASRRALHLLNIPAGSDMNRLLAHIARLEREVRDLRNELTDREKAEYLATLAARHAVSQRTAAALPAVPAKAAATPRKAPAKRAARPKAS